MKQDHGKKHHGIVAWFASNPVAANLLMLLILVSGFFTLSSLRTETFPSFPPEQVSISVTVNGGGIEDIEEGVVLKIEEALEGVQGIDTIRSTVKTGNAVIIVTQLSDYELIQLKDDIEAKVNAISNFPVAAEKPVIEAAKREVDAIWLAVSGSGNTKALKLVAQELRHQLLADSEIKQVDVSGEPEEEIGIEIAEHVLKRYGWTLTEIAAQVQAQSVNQYAGELSSDSGDINVRGDFQGYYRQNFEDMVVQANNNGSLIRLSDVATVTDNFAEQDIISRFNGENAILLKVVVTDDSSLIETSTAAKSVMKSYLQAHPLPQQVQLTTMGDQSVFISDRLDTMTENGLLGMLLVIILLALFLHPMLALWVAVGIPIAFAGALLTMGSLGFNLSLNDLTTSGFLVALGILVDDAIVIAESVYTTRQESKLSQNEPKSLIDENTAGSLVNSENNAVSLTIQGAMKVAVPATFGVLTTIAAFYPLMFIDGKLGNIFGQQAIIVIAVLVFALVESKLILPAHLAHIKLNPVNHESTKLGFPPDKNTHTNTHTNTKRKSAKLADIWYRFQQFFQQGLQRIIDKAYLPSIRWVLQHRSLSLLFTVIFFVLTLGLIPSGQVRVSFFPEIEPSVVMASFEVNSAFGQGHTYEVAEKIEQALFATNLHFKRLYQMDSDPVQAVYLSSNDNHSATITGELIEDSLRDFAADEVSKVWREQTGKLEGVSLVNFDGARRGPEAIRIELKAQNMSTLSTAAKQLKHAMAKISGVTDIRDNLQLEQSQVNIRIKPAAYSLGLTNTSIMKQVAAALYGAQAQRIQRGRDEVKVMVRYPQEDRQYLSDIDDLNIHTDNGAVIPFSTVAQIDFTDGIAQINRLDGYRAASVISGVNKRLVSSGEVIKLLQQSTIPELLAKHDDLIITLKGEASEQSKSSSSLMQGIVIALLVIYGLLAIPLRSYAKPLVIMSIIPFGVLGSILGHWIVGIPINLLSLFGTIALCGVVVNDSLVLVAAFNQFKQQGLVTTEAIITAGKSRLRAIVLTSLTTFAGLTPLLLDESSQGQFLIPMAVSLGFGILFATFTTLYVLPIVLSFQDSVAVRTQAVKEKLSLITS